MTVLWHHQGPGWVLGFNVTLRHPIGTLRSSIAIFQVSDILRKRGKICPPPMGDRLD